MENSLAEWKQRAAELGIQHARSAASWVTDGNESDESRRHKLRRIKDGDPAVEELLPRRPTLSGEFAGDLTLDGLVEDVTGKPCDQVEDSVRYQLDYAYQDAADDEFLTACEEELERWVYGD